jgi:phytoene dehydrogenase-like protein
LDKHYRNTSRFFKDERLKAAFTFQNMYLGLSPYDAPATYSLLQYTELAEGVWYPMGGMYAGIQALTKVAEKLGVKFVYNSPVKKINVGKSKVENVITTDGKTYNADLFVGNADLPYIYKELLPDAPKPKNSITSFTPAPPSCSIGAWTSSTSSRASQRLPWRRLQGLLRPDL